MLVLKKEENSANKRTGKDGMRNAKRYYPLSPHTHTHIYTPLLCKLSHCTFYVQFHIVNAGCYFYFVFLSSFALCVSPFSHAGILCVCVCVFMQCRHATLSKGE